MIYNNLQCLWWKNKDVKGFEHCNDFLDHLEDISQFEVHYKLHSLFFILAFFIDLLLPKSEV